MCALRKKLGTPTAEKQEEEHSAKESSISDMHDPDEEMEAPQPATQATQQVLAQAAAIVAGLGAHPQGARSRSRSRGSNNGF